MGNRPLSFGVLLRWLAGTEYSVSKFTLGNEVSPQITTERQILVVIALIFELRNAKLKKKRIIADFLLPNIAN